MKSKLEILKHRSRLKKEYNNRFKLKKSFEFDEKKLNKVDIDVLFDLQNCKKFIKELGYISSWSGGDVNLDSSMVWKSLASDNELFMFCNDNNIICFWYELDYDTIMIKLREFYYKRGNIIVDEDFLEKYSMNKNQFIGLL
jgi:hypothetical protein